jgi:hypothetical protein
MSNHLFNPTDPPTYPPDVLDCNTIITGIAHDVMQLRKRADDQASVAFREAVAEWVAAYGVMRKEARKLMVERIEDDG